MSFKSHVLFRFSAPACAAAMLLAAIPSNAASARVPGSASYDSRGEPPSQPDGVSGQRDGLRLVRHADGTYQLWADGSRFTELVDLLAQESGVDFTVAPELLDVAIILETSPVTLSKLLEQIRLAAGANLIMATTRGHSISRAWFTAPTPTLADAAPVTAADTAIGNALPTMDPPANGGPVPLGNELRVAGYQPGVDVAAYIREQAEVQRAASSDASGTSAGGTAGAEQSTAAAGENANAEDAEASSPPPVPLDPDALEKFFAGDSGTKTYHRLNCIQAMYLPSVNKVWFTSRQEAIAAGYKPHEICVGR